MRNPAATNFNVLSQSRADEYRAGGSNEQGNRFERATASGRARCRQCAQKIAKGEPALVGYHDFNGHGSYTAVRCWLHLECPPLPPNAWAPSISLTITDRQAEVLQDCAREPLSVFLIFGRGLARSYGQASELVLNLRARGFIEPVRSTDSKRGGYATTELGKKALAAYYEDA